MRRADPGDGQGALFTPAPTAEQRQLAVDPHVFVRRDARPTAVEAAVRVEPRSASQRARIQLRIQRAGQVRLDAEGKPFGGLTDEEISVATGLDGNTVRPRRLELVAGCKVTDSGYKRETKTGSKAIVWVAVEP